MIFTFENFVDAEETVGAVIEQALEYGVSPHELGQILKGRINDFGANQSEDE